MPRVTITVADKTPQPYRFSLERKVVTIGRGEDNDIVIDCPSVSGKHAEMHRVEGGYELRDCDSTNGIKLNGDPTKKISLKNGQEVLLGDVDFGFQLKDDELAILASEVPMESSKPTEESDGEPLPPIEESVEPEEEEVSKPVAASAPPKPTPRKPSPTPSAETSGASSTILSVVTAILVIVAFFAGLAIRYQRDMHSSFIKGVMSYHGGSDEADQPADGE